MSKSRDKPPQNQAQAEPVFAAVNVESPEIQGAHAMAAATMPDFLAHLQKRGDQICAAKLRFRDPDASDELGRDYFAFIWLSNVEHDPATGTYIGVFFEVPAEFSKWHQVGQWLRFETEDVFDWFVNDDGLLFGGYTLRATRARLPEEERAAYDEYLGVVKWAGAEAQ